VTALVTAILNDVHSLCIGYAFFDLHSLFAEDAAQKINQRAFVVVQIEITVAPDLRVAETPDLVGTKK
jgi:hypothetical protein